MNYKEKYEQALERAKELLEDMNKKEYFASNRDIEDIFPELKESEDEKMIKAIIAYISHGQHCGVSNTDMIAWLEKQGENKPTDKVEPKFKVGDWIVFNGLILHIDEVVNGYYRTTSIGDDIHNSYDWDIDNAARLWTIQEAKDGNILHNVDLLTNVLRKHLYTCVNKTNTYVRSEEDHITLSELIGKIKADLNIK